MCHYQGQLAASKKDLEKILEEHFNIKEIRSYEEVHEQQIKCTRIYNELNQKRRFLNHLVYAKRFWEETADVFEEKIREKIINYQLEHDKKLSEEQKAKLQQEKNELTEANAKRQEEFANQIKEIREEKEKLEKEKLEKENKEKEAEVKALKMELKMEKEKNAIAKREKDAQEALKKERELREAQTKAIEKQEKTLERLKRRDKRGWWKRLWNLN